MQQFLAVLSADADASTITSALTDSSIRSYLHPTVITVDGDLTSLPTFSQTAGVIATLSDDSATQLAAQNDVTQLDTATMATLIGTALNVNLSFEEPIVLAVGGWIFGCSPQYRTVQSDRQREGESWDLQGCIPSDDFANA